MLTNKGIDYGTGKANVDPETGIRHGMISRHSVMEDALDDFSFDYGKPHCAKCGGEFLPMIWENTISSASSATMEFVKRMHIPITLLGSTTIKTDTSSPTASAMISLS